MANDFEKDLRRRVAQLDAQLARECRLIEGVHLRGLPAQTGAVQAVVALADLLVSVYDRKAETRDRARLLLVADARLSGLSAYALQLLMNQPAPGPELVAGFKCEHFLTQAAAGGNVEEIWESLQPLEGLEPALLALMLTARLNGLVAQQRLAEAVELKSSSQLEALAQSHKCPKETSARALCALAGLAAAQERDEEAVRLLARCIDIVTQTDYARCAPLRDFLLELHQLHLSLLQKQGNTRPLLAAHGSQVELLASLCAGDPDTSLRVQLLYALDASAKQLEAAGHVGEALAQREAHLHTLLEAFGEHNPPVASAHAQLAALLITLDRSAEAAEHLRISRHIRRDFAEASRPVGRLVSALRRA